MLLKLDEDGYALGVNSVRPYSVKKKNIREDTENKLYEKIVSANRSSLIPSLGSCMQIQD